MYGASMALAGAVAIVIAASVSATPPPEAIERAREALAAAGVTGELRLISGEPAQWADSSLGCPTRGTMYLQVITPGHIVRFAGTDRTHEVHVAANAAVVCSQVAGGVPKRPGRAVRAPELQALVDKARADLAMRLAVPLEKIRLENFEATTWPDESLGCGPGRPGEPQARQPVAGFRLFLAANGARYTYHADSQRAIACPPIETQ